MTWGEYLQSLLKRPPMLFSTATTGVNSDDCLLAVSYEIVKTPRESGTVFYSAPASCALNGVDYHRITMHTLSVYGLQAEEFSEEVNRLFKENTAFSYNPAFQVSALTDMADCTPGYVHDLPLLMKLAMSRFALSAEDLDKICTLPELEALANKMVGQPPPFKRLMRSCNIVVDPYTDVLPVETNKQILTQMWDQLCGIPMMTF